jgi:acetoin utilization protein AcuB
MMNEPLSSIMTTDLITMSPDDPLSKAKQILFSKRIHLLPVVEGKDRLVGVITTYDLCKFCETHSEFNEIKVGDVMTTHIATLEPEEKVGAAAEVLLEHLFHAVPIVLNDQLVGIVSSFDVLKYEFEKEYPGQMGECC